MSSRIHTFHAVSFAKNFPMKELAAVFPAAQTGPHGQRLRLPADGEASFYPWRGWSWCWTWRATAVSCCWRRRSCC